MTLSVQGGDRHSLTPFKYLIFLKKKHTFHKHLNHSIEV